MHVTQPRSEVLPIIGEDADILKLNQYQRSTPSPPPSGTLHPTVHTDVNASVRALRQKSRCHRGDIPSTGLRITSLGLLAVRVHSTSRLLWPASQKECCQRQMPKPLMYVLPSSPTEKQNTQSPEFHRSAVILKKVVLMPA